MRPICGTLLLAVAAAGCEGGSTPTPPSEPAGPAPARHSAFSTQHSVLTGRVVWAGAALHPERLAALRTRQDGTVERIVRTVPNLPVVGADGGVTGAVVFLRGNHALTLDDSPGNKWPPVTVELHDERPMIRQGDGPLRTIGFVRRGDEITIVSRQSRFHSLRARGATFWTVTLPESDQPRTRRLDQAGVVELSSGANYFWMHAYLWVCDHPYYTETDSTGRWSLGGMPAGEYDVVAWLPDWRTVRQERDPETGLIARYVFRPPFAATRRVTVRDNESSAIADIPIKP